MRVQTAGYQLDVSTQEYGVIEAALKRYVLECADACLAKPNHEVNTFAIFRNIYKIPCNLLQDIWLMGDDEDTSILPIHPALDVIKAKFEKARDDDKTEES